MIQDPFGGLFLWYNAGTYASRMDINYGTCRHKDDGLHNLIYPLELAPRIPKGKLQQHKCPALKAARNQTYIIRSPIDIDISFNWGNKTISHNKLSMAAYEQLIAMDGDIFETPHHGFQIKTDYLFWTDKKPKKTTQIWIHDIPASMQTKFEDWYIVPGMLPSNVLTRQLQVPILLREGVDTINISRGQPVAAVSIFAKEKVDLIHNETIPEEVVSRAFRGINAAKLCPYTYAKEVFSRFL